MKKSNLLIGAAGAVLLLDLTIFAGDEQQKWQFYPDTVDHELVAWGSTSATATVAVTYVPMPYSLIARGPS